MAERGTEHEARIASGKLAQLEARFDFGGEATGDQPALFAGLTFSSFNPGEYQRVLRVDFLDAEIGSYVKWALQERLGVDSVWKRLPTGKTDLLAPVAKANLPLLQDLATHIHKSFVVALREFTEEGKINMSRRAPFLSGLYDGMMGLGRDSGQRVPAAYGGGARATRRAKKSSKKPADEPVIEIHPYELGVGLGTRIAMKVPPKSLKGELQKLRDG